MRRSRNLEIFEGIKKRPEWLAKKKNSNKE